MQAPSPRARGYSYTAVAPRTKGAPRPKRARGSVGEELQAGRMQGGGVEEEAVVVEEEAVVVEEEEAPEEEEPHSRPGAAAGARARERGLVAQALAV